MPLAQSADFSELLSPQLVDLANSAWFSSVSLSLQTTFPTITRYISFVTFSNCSSVSQPRSLAIGPQKSLDSAGPWPASLSTLSQPLQDETTLPRSSILSSCVWDIGSLRSSSSSSKNISSSENKSTILKIGQTGRTCLSVLPPAFHLRAVSFLQSWE